MTSRYKKIETNKTYLVDGKHKVLGLFQDPTQEGTFHEFLVVWQHIDTDAVISTRVDNNGCGFGMGHLLKEVNKYNEFE